MKNFSTPWVSKKISPMAMKNKRKRKVKSEWKKERDGPCAVEKSCHVVLMYYGTQTKLSESEAGAEEVL